MADAAVSPAISAAIVDAEAFLADVYSDARVISDGVIPRQLVTSSTHYHRRRLGHPARRTASASTSPAST